MRLTTCDGLQLALNNCAVWAKTIAVVTLGACLTACAKSWPAIPEAEYSKELVGRWQGTAGDEKEIMSININGRFVCQLHQRGFIANTLSQGVTGTISGTWSIAGRTVTLLVDGVEHEHLKNGSATSEIVSFNNKEIVLKSARGEVSTFYRINGV